MVIDRTTGKGCALSIAAKTVTRNLIADGIIGKTIAKKERPKRSVWLRVRDYGDDWVCIGGNIAHELTEEPLWVPSFIDERIWAQAVSKFCIDSRLDENVVEFLLPEMDEYLQNIPDSELISITRDFLIENGILDQPIRRHKGNTYYFDKSEIYSLDNESKLFPYEGRINHIFTVTGPDAAFFNSGVWIKAAPRFEVGMSLKECIDVWLGGCKELLLTDTILVLAWASGTVMDNLGTGNYISHVVGDAIPGILIPVVLFLVSCLVAFATGTSYGTTAIMIPIAFPLAWGVTGGEMGELCVVTIAACTCGSIFGDHCSPISDTTIMSSMGSAADLMDHARTQIPYAIVAAVVAGAIGFIPAAAGVSPIIIIPVGIAVIAVFVRLVGKSTKLEDLQREAAAESGGASGSSSGENPA